MKLLVPINSTDPIRSYIEAGAEEFYLGFQDEEWIKQFGEFSDLNRMSGFGKYANSFTFSKAISVVTFLKDMGVSAFVTFNANCYTDEQVLFIKRNYFEQLYDAGLDGVIISEPNIAKAAMECGLSVVASTMCAIYNEDIASYWRGLNVRRMILPRDLSLESIEAICRSLPDVDFEVFYMRNGCAFSDSNCLGVHHPGCGATCAFLRRDSKVIKSSFNSFSERTTLGWNNLIYDKAFHWTACALCATWRLMRAGVKSLKIVGRADSMESVCEDIGLAKKNIHIASSCNTEEEFLETMILPDNAESICALGLCCYYPEVRY